MALKITQMYFGMGSGESLQDLKQGHSVTGSVFGKVRSLQLQGGNQEASQVYHLGVHCVNPGDR